MTKRIYKIARIEDAGTTWDITGIVKSDMLFLDGTGSKYMNLSHNTAEKLEDLLLEGKQVFVSKELEFNGPELQPWDLQVREDNLSELALQKVTNIQNAKIRNDRSSEAALSALMFYGFIELNNELIDLGYAISESNREEKYLEILNTGDAELIGKLEEYLEYKDTLNTQFHEWKRLKEYEKAVNEAETSEDISTLNIQYSSAGS